jgi:ArsR family metal-binding transcriptional regulator
LGGDTFLKDPPSVNFKVHRERMTVHEGRIATNVLKDEEKADEIMEWLEQEVSEAWKKRNRILPSFKGLSKL